MFSYFPGFPDFLPERGGRPETDMKSGKLRKREKPVENKYNIGKVWEDDTFANTAFAGVFAEEASVAPGISLAVGASVVGAAAGTAEQRQLGTAAP